MTEEIKEQEADNSKKSNLDTPILLLHGLGGKPVLSFLGISTYLRYKLGYTNILLPRYPVDFYETLDECLDYLDKFLIKNGVHKDTDSLIVIGQSMGGVYAHSLHKKGWQIKISISIGSPLNGANLLNIAESYLPMFIQNALTKPPYDLLKQNIKAEAPPHPYHCITMGWFGTDFDGCVFRNEAYLDSDTVTHYSFSDHRFFNFNPRLFFKLENLITKVN